MTAPWYKTKCVRKLQLANDLLTFSRTLNSLNESLAFFVNGSLTNFLTPQNSPPQISLGTPQTLWQGHASNIWYAKLEFIV